MNNITQKQYHESAFIVWGCILAAAVLIIVCAAIGPKSAPAISKVEFINCLIGEAEDQGPDGMRAVALALQNRGTTRGVYGCTSDRVKNHKYSARTFVQADKAYEETKGLGYSWADETNGADSWYSSADLAKDPGIFERCAFTGKLKDHFFFICKKLPGIVRIKINQ